MSTQRDRTATTLPYVRRTALRVGVALALLLPGRAFAQDTALLRSLIVPGAGQAHQGHFTKASVFAGLALITGVGLVVSQVHYNQSVDKFRAEKRVYLGYQEQLDDGDIVRVGDINDTYAAMQSAFDEADSRIVWRNVFLTGLIATYALNVVDVIISKPRDLDTASNYAIQADRERVLLTRSFRF